MNESRIPKIFLIIIVIILAIGGTVAYFVLKEISSPVYPTLSDDDIDRLTIVKAIQIRLDRFYKDKLAYPETPPLCNSVSVLKDYAGFEDIEDILDNPNYSIGISADRQEFVLGTLLEADEKKEGESVFSRDADGMIFGCECDDPRFCMFRSRKDTKESLEDTLNWKTYKNEKYGFGFMYPNAFIVYKGFTENGGEPTEASSQENKFWVAENDAILRNGEPIGTGFEIINTPLSAQGWLDKNKENYTSNEEIESIKNSTFMGKVAIELEGGCNLASVCKLYVIEMPNYLIVVTHAGGEALDRILSTFKFSN